MAFDKKLEFDFDCEHWEENDEECCYNLFKKAYRLACTVHSGQTRDEGSPYITHIDGVIDILQNELQDYNLGKWIIATLHDVLEDSDLTCEELREMFCEMVANYVSILTKEDGQSIEDYIQRMRDHEDNRFIIEVKLADRLHNVRSLKYILDVNPKKVQRYINETEAYYIPLAKEFQPKFYNKLMFELEYIKGLL